MDYLSALVDFITYELPPGPPVLPQNLYINLHKCGMAVYLFSMMFYFNNFSLGAWIYLTLHGSYGVLWMLKYFAYPDPSFQRNVTVVSFIFPWIVALIPLGYSGFLMMSG